MEELQDLAVLVRNRRQQLGLSLRDLEMLSGVSRGRLSLDAPLIVRLKHGL